MTPITPISVGMNITLVGCASPGDMADQTTRKYFPLVTSREQTLSDCIEPYICLSN